MTTFGLRYAIRRPAWAKTPRQDLYKALVDQCEWGDKLGFTTVMISEHHGSPDGYMPSPMVVGGAIAARTENMRIRISSLIPTLHNPVRLAEDLAMLDILSNGRVDPVLSGGYVGTEFDMLGTSLSNRKAHMDMIVPFLRKAWEGQPFEWEGKTVHVTPRPVQRPVPVWMGGASKAAARRAAKHADLFQPSRADLFDTYYEEQDRLGIPRKPGLPRSTMAWVAEDPDEFWEQFGPHALHENNEYGQWYEDWDAWNGYVKTDSLDTLRETGLYPILTPEELIEKAQELGDDGFVMLHPLCGGCPPDVAWKSLKLVGDKVLPELLSQEGAST